MVACPHCGLYHIVSERCFMNKNIDAEKNRNIAAIIICISIIGLIFLTILGVKCIENLK